MTISQRIEDSIDTSKIIQTEDGFRIRETSEYVIEVHAMLFNWRLIVMLPNQNVTIEHGYCYFGRDLESLARAIAAGLEWADPLATEPTGFDKKAF